MGIPNLVLRVHVKDQSAFPSSGMRHASVLWLRGSPLFPDILCAGAGVSGGQPVCKIVDGDTDSCGRIKNQITCLNTKKGDFDLAVKVIQSFCSGFDFRQIEFFC